MAIKKFRSIFVVLAMLLALFFVGGNSTYASTTGTCTVTREDGKVLQYNNFYDAWEYCDDNLRCTLTLTSDCTIYGMLKTGIENQTEIYLDMNGYDISCTKDSAFQIGPYGTFKLYNSKAKTETSIISGATTSALRNFGNIDVKNICFKSCENRSLSTGEAQGGAIYMSYIKFLGTISKPHADINNCSFVECESGLAGGAISYRVNDLFFGASDAESNAEPGVFMSNCTFDDCDGGNTGGAMYLECRAVIQHCTFTDCSSINQGGTIFAANYSDVELRHCTITKARSKFGAGLYVKDAYTIKDPQFGVAPIKYVPAAKVLLQDTKITYCVANRESTASGYGAGVYVENSKDWYSKAKAQLILGGETVIRNNYVEDSSAGREQDNMLSNVELDKNMVIRFTDQGLRGEAYVGVGTSISGDEVKVGDAGTWGRAEKNVVYLHPDHTAWNTDNKLSTPEEEKDNWISVYQLNPQSEFIYIGKSRKIVIKKFMLTNGKENVPVKIDNENHRITAEFQFGEGLGGWDNNPWVCTWWAPGGNIRVKGQVEPTQWVGSADNKFENATITYKKLQESEKDYIVIERNGGRESWEIVFKNVYTHNTKVTVVNGEIKDKVETQATIPNAKSYWLQALDTVQMIGYDVEGKVFDYWSYELKDREVLLTFRDIYNQRPKISVPHSSLAPEDKREVIFTPHYTVKNKTVTVINGTLENGKTTGTFGPNEEVKVTTTLKNFAYWEIVSGNPRYEAKYLSNTNFSFKMGTTQNNTYNNVVVRAVAIDLKAPVSSLASGTYTGDQKTKLSCETKSTKIFYALDDSSDFKEYDGKDINLTCKDYKQSETHKLQAYSVLYDVTGKEIRRSSTVTYNYTICNPSPVTIKHLKVTNGTITHIDDKTISATTEADIMPGTWVKLKCDPKEGYEFDKWVIKSGKLVLSEYDIHDSTPSFIMPNSDVELEATYTKLNMRTASCVNGTVNGCASVRVAVGRNVTAAAKANYDKDGYRYYFAYWTSNDMEISLLDMFKPTFVFNMPDKNVKLEAVYLPVKLYNVTINNGAITKVNKTVTYQTSGVFETSDWLRIEAAPAPTEDYVFDRWEIVKGNPSINPLEKSISIHVKDKDIELTATYRRITKDNKDYVTVINGTFAESEASINSVQAEKRTWDTTVVLQPDSDTSESKFLRWDVSTTYKQDETNKISFTMPHKPVSAIAIFAEYSLVTINGGNRAANTSDLYVERGLYECEQNVEIKANVPKNMEFDHWEIVSAPSSFTLTEAQKKSANTIVNIGCNKDIVLKAVFSAKYSYTVTNGTISVNGGTEKKSSGYAKAGDTLKVEFNSDIDGAEFDYWIADGISLTTAQKTSPTIDNITMPSQDVLFTAVLKSSPKELYRLSVAQGYIGTDTSKKVQLFGAGTDLIKVTALNPGDDTNSTYVFDHWETIGITLTEAQAKSEQIVIIMPSNDVQLTAVYKHYVSVTAIHGIVNTSPASTHGYVKGESVSITASSASGMTFDHWDVIGLAGTTTLPDETVNITMPDNDVILVARYKITPVAAYSLHTVNGTNKLKGAVDSGSETGTYAEGDTVTIEPVNPGSSEAEKAYYKFAYWKILNAPSGFTLTETQRTCETAQDITMPEGNVILKAVYLEKFATVCINGVVKVEGAEVTEAFEGTTLTVEAKDKSAVGMTFSHWEAEGITLTSEQRNASSFTTTMPSNEVCFEAIYTTTPILPYELVLVRASVVDPSVPLLTSVKNTFLASTLDDNDEETGVGSAYFEGSQVNVKADDVDDAVFDHWETEGITLTEAEQISPSLTITMPDTNVTMTAVYRKSSVVPHKLTVTNGKVTSGGNAENMYFPGSSVSATADEKDNYSFIKWRATGIELTDEQLRSKTVTIDMPDNDVTLEAEYRRMTYNATVIHGTVNGYSKKIFAKGDLVEAAASIGSDMTFEYWKATGIELTEVQKRSPIFQFTMPGNDITLEAVYKESPIGLHTLFVNQGYLENNKVKSEGQYRIDQTVAVSGRSPEETNTTRYVFDHWEIVSAPDDFTLTDKQRTTENIVVTMPAGDVSLKAVYTEYQEANTVYMVHGTIDGTSGAKTKMFNKGDTVSVTADTGAGLEFDKWIANGLVLTETQATTANISFTMPDNDVILTAKYKSSPMVLFSMLTLNGVNRKSDSTGDWYEASAYEPDVTVSVKYVNPGKTEAEKYNYKFKCWTVVSAPIGFKLTDEQAAAEEFVVTMPGGEVTLKAETYERYGATAKRGTVNDLAENSIFEGDTIHVKASPAAGMVFDHWECSGLELTEEQKTADEFYSVMPANSIALEAVYKLTPINSYKLTVENGKIIEIEGQEGSFTSKYYYEGSTIYVKADTIKGKTFDHWEAEGITLTAEEIKSTSLTITMPDNEVTLVAKYTVNTGDNTKIILFAGLGLIAVAGAAGVLVARRKKEN